jgi:hypothetical protein
MSTTYISAVNEMYAKFEAAITAEAPAIVGSVPEYRFYGRDKNTVPPVSGFFVEVSQTTNTDRQTGFGVSSRKFTTQGVLYMRIFAPKTGANNFEKGRKLADALKKRFRVATPGARVWYRAARVQELPEEKGAYRLNVAVDYVYDEIQ